MIATKVSVVLTWGGFAWKDTKGALCNAEIFFFLSGSYTGIHFLILQIYVRSAFVLYTRQL